MAGQPKSASYQGVLNIVRQWPTAQQIALVKDVLKAISSRVEPPKQRRRTLDRALGLLTTDKPAPTDEEVEQWLEERRQSKFL